MASKNKLLGSGKVEQEEIIKVEAETVSPVLPTWRYSKDGQAKIVKTVADLEKLEKEGWVDHPGKVKLLPGHEKLFSKSKGNIFESGT